MAAVLTAEQRHESAFFTDVMDAVQVPNSCLTPTQGFRRTIISGESWGTVGDGPNDYLAVDECPEAITSLLHAVTFSSQWIGKGRREEKVMGINCFIQ